MLIKEATVTLWLWYRGSINRNKKLRRRIVNQNLKKKAVKRNYSFSGLEDTVRFGFDSVSMLHRS